MAAPVVNFTVISTPDAAPTSAPYRISRDAAKDDVTFTWTITFSGSDLGYWHERIGGALRNQGTIRNRLGNVCGIGCRCGGAGVRLLRATSSPQTRSGPWSDADSAMPSEGDYRFGVDALNHAGEWSATT